MLITKLLGYICVPLDKSERKFFIFERSLGRLLKKISQRDFLAVCTAQWVDGDQLSHRGHFSGVYGRRQEEFRQLLACAVHHYWVFNFRVHFNGDSEGCTSVNIFFLTIRDFITNISSRDASFEQGTEDQQIEGPSHPQDQKSTPKNKVVEDDRPIDIPEF
jgi:hypothetical protein